MLCMQQQCHERNPSMSVRVQVTAKISWSRLAALGPASSGEGVVRDEHEARSER